MTEVMTAAVALEDERPARVGGGHPAGQLKAGEGREAVDKFVAPLA